MPADTWQGSDVPPEHLLPLALARPVQAYAEATSLLAARPTPLVASIARQARAIVIRDYGNQVQALAELRKALRAAQRSTDRRREADVRATLGLTLGWAGRTAAGLAQFDRALEGCRGVLAGQILTRRAALLRTCGRYDEALIDLRRAIVLLHRAEDQVWEARARSHRFLIYAALGRASLADRDNVVAERLFAATGQDLEYAMTVHNRADVAFQVGDLPAALTFLDDAEARYAALQVHRAALPMDRCAVLLAAGLADEALTVMEQALRRHEGRGGDLTRTAELLFAVAAAARAAGQPLVAAGRAAAAGVLFRRQRRRAWQARAAFVELVSLRDAGTDGRRVRWRAGPLADELDTLQAPEAPAAHLLAARVAAERGRGAEADRHLARAARYRYRGPTFGRAAGWLAQAMRADAKGSSSRVLTACRLGLRAAAEHQRSLAAPDLRAHAAAHGAELAAMAQREAVRRGDARMLLTWSERWRASALAIPPVLPHEDRQLTADLAALRDIVRRLDAARLAEQPTAVLDQQRRRLEAAIRARARRQPADSGPESGKEAVGHLGDLLDGLNGHRLVEISTVDGRLYATTVVGRRVRTHPAGTIDAVSREVEFARFLLRRMAYGFLSPRWMEDLAVAGERLQQMLFGHAAGVLEEPTVVVPPARLHAVPWSLLPVLRRTSVVVAPSAAIWLRAGRLPSPRRRGTALIVGPGLHGAGAEVDLLIEAYPNATVLRDGSATSEATLAALDGAFTAHVAAHGVFRADNPLFTALSLDDGPLTVYDLARLRKAPQRLVLSSCDSAIASPVGPDELLGTVSALVPRGMASLLASVVPVNDAATVALMATFHARLQAGDSFGSALGAMQATADATGSPVAVATALSFVALGR